nr:serine O-acetyltransferase EpsC [Sphingobium sp. SCG-1]
MTAYWDIDAIVDELDAARSSWRNAQRRHVEYGSVGFPSRPNLTKIIDALCGALFPLRLGPEFVRQHNENAFVAETLNTVLSRLYGQIRIELAYAREGATPEDVDAEAGQIIGKFAAGLPALRTLLDTDVDAAFASDPAARSVDEVLICYPSMSAIIHHRLAHSLYLLGVPVVARIISEVAHSRTGIDIHPGATIGHSFFIDHGNGVVIGETAIIGNRVRLYQGVTLGARNILLNEQGFVDRGVPRHPIIEDDVVIYAGATVLGRIIVGRGSVIAGNVWLTKSVPATSNVQQASTVHEVKDRAVVSAPHRLKAL